MQSWFIFALCLGCVVCRDLYVGGGASTSHYEQHSQSVEEARKKINDQLGTSNPIFTPCVSCSGHVSSAHDYQTRDSGLGVGVGFVGLSSGLTGSLSSSSGSLSSSHLLQPLYVSPSTGSSSNSLSSSHYTQQSQPIIIPVGGGSESYRHHSEQRSQSQSAPILISPTGGSESYQRHYEKRIESQASPIIVSPSTGAESYQRHYEKRVESQSAPVVVSPSGGSESYQRHFEKRVQSQAAPIVMPNSGSESYQRHYEKRVQSQSAPLIIPPAGGSESYQHHFEKRVESQASPIVVAPTGASESYHQQSQRITQSQAAPIYVHPTAGSESYHREEEHQKVESRPTPVLYSPGGSSSHSLYSHKQISQSVPTIQYVPPSSVGSEYSEFSQKMVQNQARPITIYPSSSSQISHDSLRQSSNSQTAGSAYPYYPLTSGSAGLSTEFASSQLGLGASLNLNNYMSESERLARLQAQSVNPGGLRAGSSVYNSGSDLGVSVSDSNRPGYRSQSWEKSSKWASGTEYGSDGNPKNYNLLSTAESEQHNINGNQAGYKAATTTLDDDGKVSTYSIHTR